MAVKIRLARRGRKKQPFYHIVVADARAPRDGKYIEQIGSYNPMTKPATVELDRDKALQWLQNGAQPTETVNSIFRFKGVNFRKHLLRGVKKGAFDLEQADKLWKEWIDVKEARIESRREASRQEKQDFWKKFSGEIKEVKKQDNTEALKEFTEAGKSTEEE
ncbi:MAG TPA: 30S ribosomal protein S16 [Saprospiraceae bacterium]|nr:30S ribosomal protein S16 [Saprospiraceae bacterium]MCB9327889.1 30S ribosomal protein S16 [Lewinellaceae bacterium]HPK09179.1 30S ribosomal protein S16 [Saprospiraceae bacterium]HPQ22106.1 30S ribosomal protein S16 [Saprospiraceae bacterium]HRX28877.1 30S ribosomal protein S16 [Saprospiraceae bacterium]